MLLTLYNIFRSHMPRVGERIAFYIHSRRLERREVFVSFVSFDETNGHLTVRLEREANGSDILEEPHLALLHYMEECEIKTLVDGEVIAVDKKKRVAYAARCGMVYTVPLDQIIRV